SSALTGRPRHGMTDALLGGLVALCAITVTHAALPHVVETAPAPPAAVRLAPPTQPPAAEPAALIAFQHPAPGHDVVSPFGLRQLPWEQSGRLHAGVDIAAPVGTPVLAAA